MIIMCDHNFATLHNIKFLYHWHATMVVKCVTIIVVKYLNFAIGYVTKVVEGGPYMQLH
jgi:hypothetical protein